MSKPALKFSGLVAAGKITVPVDAAPSNNFDRVDDVQADGLVSGREYMVRIADLVDSPYQTRLRIDPARVDDLAAQLEDQGQQDAIEFRRGKAPGTFEIIKGHTRKAAAITLDWTEIRGLYRELSDKDAEIACMVDNTGEHPKEYEYALAFKRAMDQGYAKTQAAAGRMFGFSQATVSKGLAMLALPPAVLALLDAQPGLFGVRTAAVVAELWEKHPEHTQIVLDGIRQFNDGMDQGELAKWVNEQVAKASRKEPAAPQNPPKAAPRRHSINSATGNECYVTILKEKALVIELKDLDIPKEETQAAVFKALEELVKSRKGANNG